MQYVRLGSVYRAVRVEMRLRQADVAARAGVSQTTISKIERGQLREFGVQILQAVAEALEADLDVGLRWRGPKLARLLDRRHAWLQDYLTWRLEGWEVHVEQSFNHYGDRGSVDILAWRADVDALLIIELKPEILDLQDTVRSMDIKARVVPKLVLREYGWRPKATALVLAVPATKLQRDIVAEHASLLAAALPARTRDINAWLRKPSGSLRGIWFVSCIRPGTTNQKQLVTRRVSRPRKTAGGALRAAIPAPEAGGKAEPMV